MRPFVPLSSLLSLCLVQACAGTTDGPGVDDTDPADTDRAGGDTDDDVDTDVAETDAVDTDPLEVTIPFAPVVGEAAFACGATYDDLGDPPTDVTPVDFRFYVHDVALVDAEGVAHPVALDQDGVWQSGDVALLDFEDGEGACEVGTVETNAVVRGTVPAGEYVALTFRVGVPAAINHADLVDQPSPLDLTSMWWSWNMGHLFLVMVTRADVTTPEPGVNDHHVHLGSTGCSGDATVGETVTCAKPNRPRIRLDGYSVGDTVTVDFAAPLDRADLGASVGCHSFSAEPCAFPFDRIGLNWWTGSETPSTQRLFRLE